ncbi:hypothetical protein [Bartonella jaculi]|uniref:hypothetical protein n=1 Tax=Bartonella jaculi TaxID=686226 RepID=UPI0031E70479
MDWRDIPTFYKTLTIRQLALHLLILPDVCRHLLRHFCQEQLYGDLWIISPENMKGRRDSYNRFPHTLINRSNENFETSALAVSQ